MVAVAVILITAVSPFLQPINDFPIKPIASRISMLIENKIIEKLSKK